LDSQVCIKDTSPAELALVSSVGPNPMSLATNPLCCGCSRTFLTPRRRWTIYVHKYIHS